MLRNSNLNEFRVTAAGHLRHRIRIETPTRTRDANGEPLLTWSTVANTWAAVSPISGREVTQAAKVEGDITHRVTIRFRSGLSPDMRIVFNGRVLNIVSIRDLEERERRMVIDCREET